MNRRVTLRSEVKVLEYRSRRETESEQGDLVAWSRPEAERSSHGQAEALVTHRGGPNGSLLKKAPMSCG